MSSRQDAVDEIGHVWVFCEADLELCRVVDASRLLGDDAKALNFARTNGRELSKDQLCDHAKKRGAGAWGGGRGGEFLSEK